MIGRTLGHFRIISALGEGGMGAVFRAHDLHLERDVAIKVLHPGMLADEIARARFRREALALSRVHHSGIAVVHDFDTSGGIDFLVMELVPGETLAARLSRGPLPAADAVRIAIQVATALATAHAAGVVHRDLKPSNIILMPDGTAKVLDFGLAKRLLDVGEHSASLTDSRTMLGTLRYMAPEQLRTEAVDARTDVYSLGVVLYEMVTAHLPHDESQSIAFAAAVLNQPPIAPGLRGVGVLPAGLEAVILRCLEKDPADRFPSANAVRAGLEDVLHGATPARAASPRVRWHRLAVPAIVVGAVAAAVTAGWLLRTSVPGRATAVPSLAVLPLVNLSGDAQQDYFVDGMTDELIENLSQIRALRIISRTSIMSYKGTRETLPQIARELGVEDVVEGTVVRAAGHVRVNAQLVRVHDDRSLWAQSFERPIGDVLALQQDVARVIAEQIRVELRPAERKRLERAAPVDSAAVEASMKCLYYQDQATSDGYRQAIDWGNRAIALDPGYARAYAALASAYTLSSSIYLPANEAMPRARAAANRALEFDRDQVEARVQLAYVVGFYDWRWGEAERELRRAIESGPSSAAAHETYGYLLVVNRRFAEAIEQTRQAHQLDPLSRVIAASELWPLYEGRRYAEAVSLARQLLATDPDNVPARLVLGQALFMQGDAGSALPELRRVAAANPMMSSSAAYALAMSGHRDEAGRIRDLLAGTRGAQFTQPYLFAVMDVGFGERDRAFAELERAVGAHSEELAFLQVDPFLDPIRKDPRFTQLLKRVGFGG